MRCQRLVITIAIDQSWSSVQHRSLLSQQGIDSGNSLVSSITLRPQELSRHMRVDASKGIQRLTGRGWDLKEDACKRIWSLTGVIEDYWGESIGTLLSKQIENPLQL